MLWLQLFVRTEAGLMPCQSPTTTTTEDPQTIVEIQGRTLIEGQALPTTTLTMGLSAILAVRAITSPEIAAATTTTATTATTTATAATATAM